MVTSIYTLPFFLWVWIAVRNLAQGAGSAKTATVWSQPIAPWTSVHYKHCLDIRFWFIIIKNLNHWSYPVCTNYTFKMNNVSRFVFLTFVILDILLLSRNSFLLVTSFILILHLNPTFLPHMSLNFLLVRYIYIYIYIYLNFSFFKNFSSPYNSWVFTYLYSLPQDKSKYKPKREREIYALVPWSSWRGTFELIVYM